MKIKSLRLPLLLLLVIAAVICFASCKKTPEQPTEQPVLQQDITVAKQGDCLVSVVRPDGCKEIVTNAAKNIRNELSELTGDSDIALGTDWTTSGATDSTTYEILVGPTVYEESKSVLNEIKYGEYKIVVKGNKIIVGAWTETGVSKASVALMGMLREMLTEDKSIVFPVDTEKKASFDKCLNKLPHFEGGTYSFSYDCGDNSQMITFKSTVDEYNAYGDTLNANGFTDYAENKIGDNLFNTYTTSDNQVTTIYKANEKTTRIIVDSLNNTGLAGLASENVYTKKCDTLMTMIGTGKDNPATTDSNECQNGMCFIYRLEDGSFIIYDGGFKDSKGQQNAARIYSTLKAQAPDPKNIVIAAWIITHAHGDHVGAFQSFGWNYANGSYASNITIEKFIINYPSDQQFKLCGDNDSAGRTNTMDALNATKKNGDKAFKDVQIIKAHPGMVFHLRNFELEVLYSLELYAPTDMTYFNTSTIVTRIKVGGQTIMMLGDMSPDANKIIREMYGKVLAADIVQVAHHGYQGGSTEFYQLVDPTWVFWPMGSADYNGGYKDNNRSSYFFSSKKVKGIYVAEWNTFTLKLPYDGENITITPNS